MASPTLSLTVSLADQDFARTKSVGIYNLATGLTRHLAESGEFSRLTILTNGALDETTKWPASVLHERHELAVRGRLARMFWDQWAVYRAAQDAGNDWLLLPKGYASFLRRPPVKLAVIIHDAMPDYYRHNHPGAVGGTEQAYFRRALNASLRNAKIIFTDTQFGAREVQRLAAEANLPNVSPIVAGIGFTRTAPLALERTGIVVLASPFPHKRTRQAVEWLARWQTKSDYAAGVTWIGRLPEGLRLPELRGWAHLERLPEPDYRAQLARAQALVFFTEYEGFGMPPVEAAIAGACPVFSDIPATREVMGDAGLSFDNANYESFARALNQARATPAKLIGTWADELLNRHNWRAVADRVIAALR